MSLAVPLRSDIADPPTTAPRVALEAEFRFSGEDYRELLAGSRADAFRHPVWLEAAYRHLVPARGGRPVIVTLREPSGKALLGVLPLALRRKNGLRLLECADFGAGDSAAPVLAPSFVTQLAADPSLGSRIRAALPAHDILRIRPVRPEWTRTWTQLLGGRIEPLGFSSHEAHLASPYAAWRARALRPSARRNLDRKRRRLERSGHVELRRLADPAEAASAVALIAKLRAGRFPGDPIQDAPVRRFYETVAREGVASSFCGVHALCLDGEPIARLLTVEQAGRQLYLLIGCDYERFGPLSPGLLAYDLLMEAHADGGGRVFDFTIGDEPFKRDYGTVAVAMSAVIGAPTLRGRAGLAAWRWRERRRAAAIPDPDPEPNDAEETT